MLVFLHSRSCGTARAKDALQQLRASQAAAGQVAAGIMQMSADLLLPPWLLLQRAVCGASTTQWRSAVQACCRQQSARTSTGTHRQLPGSTAGASESWGARAPAMHNKYMWQPSWRQQQPWSRTPAAEAATGRGAQLQRWRLAKAPAWGGQRTTLWLCSAAVFCSSCVSLSQGFIVLLVFISPSVNEETGGVCFICIHYSLLRWCSPCASLWSVVLCCVRPVLQSSMSMGLQGSA